jgi:penicillin V acylase-like amidase (Ntn superfamily)
MKLVRPITLSLAVGLFINGLVQACTIFVLTDTNRTPFFNNEDWSNPKTRIWFVPAGSNYNGCVYVGFDNGWAQGGLNNEGLACDWVAGFQDNYEAVAALRTIRGNPTQRMLETCATVEDAIAFYNEYREPSFSRASILVADKTGASVILGAKNGKLDVQRDNQCRGFGYGQRTLDQMLAKSPEPTVASGVKILRACRQKGQYATKYSNVFEPRVRRHLHLPG